MSPQPPKTLHLPLTDEKTWAEDFARTEGEWARVELEAGWLELKMPDRPYLGAAAGMSDFDQVEAPRGFSGLRAARRGKTTVMFSAGRHDGKWWLHVSIAHPDRMPSYMDLVELKRIFIGEDREAVMVLPPKAQHVSFHDRCLHLWACLEPEGSGLPDFAGGGDSI